MTPRSLAVLAGVAAVLALVGYGWHSALLERIVPAESTPSTGAALSAAGVHKCASANGVLYVDHACPQGSREVKAGGGAVTVMAFPKPAPAADAAASGPARLIQGLTPAEADRLREQQIQKAAGE